MDWLDKIGEAISKLDPASLVTTGLGKLVGAIFDVFASIISDAVGNAVKEFSTMWMNVPTPDITGDGSTPVTVGGSGGASYTLPAATANALGGVKLQVFGEAIGNASENVAVAAAAAPTKTEYDALVASYNALAKQFNRLISGLASSGVIQVPSGK